MGREATCEARLGRQRSLGKAQLETDEVVFRGDFRVKVPLKSITRIGVRGGTLTLAWPEGTLTLELGAQAEAWAKAIQNPKTVIEKLGVKPGQVVAALDITDAAFLRDLERALGAAPLRRAPKRADLVFLGVPGAAALSRLAKLADAIRPAGGIWAVWPKGRSDVNEDRIRDAALRVGLVDVKVVRFSETHGALKLVVPRSAR